MQADIRCIVLDNLSRGHRELVTNAELIVGDTGDTSLIHQDPC